MADSFNNRVYAAASDYGGILRELGTVNYRSYGVLEGTSEALLRSLISQMIEEGYLYQTKDQYSLLKIGDIAPLKDENARVILRTAAAVHCI